MKTTKDDIYFFIREEPYGFLSNFWRAVQIVDGVAYDSNERYYQVQKAGTPKIKAWIFNAPSPYLAMVVGHNLRANHPLPDGAEIRADWTVSTRLETMLKGLRAKFNQNPDLGKMLLATGTARLHEDNPNDPFWSFHPVNFEGVAQGGDHLGKLLMQVRDELSSFLDSHTKKGET